MKAMVHSGINISIGEIRLPEINIPVIIAAAEVMV